MLDFEGMVQYELNKVNQAIGERDDERSFIKYHQTDQEFLRQCGIAWPQRS